MLKIAVCDDNPLFLQSAASLIEAWTKQSGISSRIFTYDNGDDLITGNRSLHLDIVFLDIIMPLLNGMDTAKELRQQDAAVQIVFLTSSPEYALESYEVKAAGYLLKPITYEKFKKTLDEFAHTVESEPKNLVVKTSFGYQKLYFHDIEYAEAQNKQVVFHLRTGLSVEATVPFRTIEDKLLNNTCFFKCHRSYLVYLPNVDRFSSTKLVTKSGREIPIARGCAKAFKEAYFALLFQE